MEIKITRTVQNVNKFIVSLTESVQPSVKPEAVGRTDWLYIYIEPSDQPTD